jgi:hypothetical protein
MILGIAYHSPLDVLAVMPLELTITMDPAEIADVFAAEQIVKNYNSRMQLVFSSEEELFRANIPIIDQGPWGRVINLTNHELEKILGRHRNEPKKSRSGQDTSPCTGRLPGWVRL